MHRRQWIALSAAVIGSAGLALAQTTTTTTATSATSTATTAPAARRAPSPAGTAATQVGGTWSAPDKDGEQRYSGGKWIEVTYSRPMLRGRADVFGKGADYGKKVPRRSSGVARGRESDDEAEDRSSLSRSAARKWRRANTTCSST